ncbi:MAG: tryptophan synthase subunit alpha [bacterium]
MKISTRLEELKKKGEKALAVFATIGDPDMDTSFQVFSHLHDWGADILELGIPYSDPLMDGPTLQQSYRRSLNFGFALKDVPPFVERLRNTTDIAALIMTCYNPVYRYGVNRFFRDVSNAGIDSILLTDLPPEEWGESLELARSYGLGTVFLITPTTPVRRMEEIARLSIPFVYSVSRTGITGARDELPPELKSYMAFVKDVVSRPVLIGFGISTPEQAGVAGELADGIVVGSAAVSIIQRHLDSNDEIMRNLENFVGELKEALVP